MFIATVTSDECDFPRLRPGNASRMKPPLVEMNIQKSLNKGRWDVQSSNHLSFSVVLVVLHLLQLNIQNDGFDSYS